MRYEIVGALACLCDRRYQKRVWIAGERTDFDGSDHFELDFEILYEITEVLPNPSLHVGRYLFNDVEVELLERVHAALDPLVARLQTYDAEPYLGSSGWAAVCEASGRALAEMVRNGLPSVHEGG